MEKQPDKANPKEKEVKNEEKEKKQSPPPEQPAEDDSFDFGGLPKRDLKKNLGCG